MVVNLSKSRDEFEESDEHCYGRLLHLYYLSGIYSGT